MVNGKSAFKVKMGIAMMGVVLMVLAGCGSVPREMASPNETVPLVQQAVDRYVLSYKSPPVKVRQNETDEYARYPVDFRLLMQTLQLSAIPNNAYDNGGPYYYVLLPTHEGWKVKLIEMVIWQAVSDIQDKADAYRKQTGRIPAGEKYADGLYRLDAKALGLTEDRVRSVYSPQMLPLLISEEGSVVIDYAFEIMRKVQSMAYDFPVLPDMRDLLIRDSHLLPVHSLPYKWANDEPVISAR